MTPGDLAHVTRQGQRGLRRTFCSTPCNDPLKKQTGLPLLFDQSFLIHHKINALIRANPLGTLSA
jgi:hypothetical protein